MVAIQWQERLETANEAVTGNKRGGVGVCSLGVHMCYSIGGGEWGAGYQLTRLDTHVEEERERQKEWGPAWHSLRASIIYRPA